MLSLGLALVGELTDTELPAEISARVRADHEVNALAAQVRQWLASDRVSDLGIREKIKFHLRMTNSFADEIRYLFRLAMAPTIDDLFLLNSPRAPSFLYYVIRPFRLVGKCVRRAVNLVQSKVAGPTRIRVALIRLRVLLFLFMLTSAWLSYAAELNQEALKAWENYIAGANLRMQNRVTGKSPFLWLDEDPMRKQHVNSGDIVVSPIGDSHPLLVPHGLIHHWIGAVFIPGATIRDLTEVVSDYGRYNEIYRPALVKAELLDSTGGEQKFSILWVQRVLLVTAAFYSELDSKSVSLNSRQGYMTFSTTRVQQIVHYGEKDEQKLAPDEGSGYLWRLVSFARFEERDGGLYLELEVMGLSKDLPASLRLLFKPVIDHVPRQALGVTLEQTRQAIGSLSR